MQPSVYLDEFVRSNAHSAWGSWATANEIVFDSVVFAYGGQMEGTVGPRSTISTK